MSIIRFAHPIALVLIVPAIWLVFRITLSGKSRSPRTVISFVIRTLLLVSLLGIMAGLEVRQASVNICRLYVVDNSGSIFADTPSLLKAIQEDVKTLRPGDTAGLIAFGKDAGIEMMPVAPDKFPEISGWPDRGLAGTDIENALSLVSLLSNPLHPPSSPLSPSAVSDKGALQPRIPGSNSLSLKLPEYKGGLRGGEVFLLSDGNQTKGDAFKTLAGLKQFGIKVFTIPIGPAGFKDIRVSSNRLMQTVRAGEPVELSFTIQSTTDTVVDAYLAEGRSADSPANRGKTVLKEYKGLGIAKNQPFVLTVSLPPLTAATAVYEMWVSTNSFKEFCLENNSVTCLMRRTGKPSALYIGKDNNPVARIIRANNDFDLTVSAQLPPLTLPLYDIIILDDFPLKTPPHLSSPTRGEGIIKGDDASVMQYLATAVTNGKGLFIIGGPSSFGLGNYPGSALDEISPVWTTPQDALALAVILDSSGSMAEPSGIADKNKFRIATTALESALGVLGKQDKLEVIAFNQGFEVIYSLSQAGPEALHKALNGVKPNGSTIIIPPIQQAQKTLSSTKADKKHIILLSDGYSTGNEGLNDFEQAGKELKDAGITISVMATGQRIMQENLAALCSNQINGKLYQIKAEQDLSALAGMMKDDLVLKKELFREGDRPFMVEALKSDGILKGLTVLPPVYGYNRTALKERAELVAGVKESTTRNVPLIAQWQYGQGRVAVFTGSLSSAPSGILRTSWGKDWLNWPPLAQLVTQALRWLTPTDEPGGNMLTRVEENGGLRISVMANKPSILSGYRYKLTNLSGINIDGEIPQVGADKYETVITGIDEGLYYITVSAPGSATPMITPVVVPYSSEWTRFGPDRTFLTNLAEISGGRILDRLNDYPRENHQGFIYQRVDTLLMLLSLGLFILDLLIKVILHKPLSLRAN